MLSKHVLLNYYKMCHDPKFSQIVSGIKFQEDIRHKCKSDIKCLKYHIIG